MATQDGIITIARLRFAVGETTNALDGELVARRKAAIELIENWTGRSLLDRDYTTDARDFLLLENPDRLAFAVPDAKPAAAITLAYSAIDAEPGAVPTEPSVSVERDRVYSTPDSVMIYSEEGSNWSDVLRLNHPTPTLTTQVGLDSVPAPIGEACALIVREMLEGSSFDEVPKMSPVERLLAPYRKSIYGAYIRPAR